MEISTIWWLLAGIAVILELLTGTFYLLMLALGLAAGALAAHAGVGARWQYLIAAGVGGGAVWLWHLKQVKSKTNQRSSVDSDKSVHLDIGSTVEVFAWSDAGTARVSHRGAEWDARLYDIQLYPVLHEPGRHRITAIEGNTLVLAPV